MTMKIDGNRTPGNADATRRLETPKTVERTGTDRATAKTDNQKTDRVEVSSDARLMTSALKAANDAPAIRQDAVERARKLLESGELGKDSAKVADKLIDDLLGK
jgi:flagellar biosynthesis anti-sigma factor FlgM